MIRSSGGNKLGLLVLGLNREEREASDQRILGSGDFVAEALRTSKDLFERESPLTRMSLSDLSRKVSSYFEIKEGELRSANKRRSISQAKSVFGYVSIKEMGYIGREVGKYLNIRGYSAIRRAAEGEKIIDMYPRFWDTAQQMVE